jgi:hypothetical protein
VARSADQHLPCYRLNQVDNSSLDPYKYVPADGIQDTTLYLYFSTCKGFGLVGVARAKPCRELSQVFTQAPEVVSKIGELLYPYLSL